MTNSAQPQVAEIVTFQLNTGVSDDAYIELNQTSHAYINGASGFVSRHLSKGEDGSWTDYTVWQNIADAKAAQAGFMAQDFAPAMIAAIDSDTLSMQHQQVLWQPS